MAWSATEWDPEKLMVCPYDDAHKISVKRFQYHLIKCRKNHPKKDFVPCPFNAQHVMLRPALRHHVATCPDRSAIEQYSFKGSTQDSDGFYLKGDTSLPGYAANQPWDFHPTESWDEDDQVASSPSQPVVRSNRPETKPQQDTPRPRDRRALAVDTNPGHPATRPSTNSVYTARPPTNSVYMYGVQKTNQATESRPVNSLDLPQTNTARPATKHVVSGRGMGLLAMMSKPISPGRLAVQGLQTSSFVNGSVVPTSSLGNSSGFPASSFGNTSIVATSSLGSSPDVSTNSLGNSSGFPAGSFGNTSGMPTSSGFLTAMDKSSSCEFAKDTGCAPATPGQVYNHARSGFFSSQFSAQEALSRSRASSDGLPAKTPDSAREISRDVTTASATINRHSVESSHDVPARGAGATNPRDPREDIPQQAPHTSGLGGVGMGVKSSHSPGRGVGRARLMAEARKNNFGRICGAYRSAVVWEIFNLDQN